MAFFHKSRFFETWYGSYAILGAIASGLIPILLPLWTQQHSSAANVGIVMSLFGLGQLSAPIWGEIADMLKLNRILFLMGLLVIGLSILGITFVPTPVILGVLSLMAGLGFSLTNTLANLWIVERFSYTEVSERVGALQRTYGIGQVFGLAIASLLSATHIKIALVVTALMAFSSVLFYKIMPITAGREVIKPRRPALEKLHPKIQPFLVSISQAYHLLHFKNLLGHLSKTTLSIIIFNILWFIVVSASSFFFSFYPIIMKYVYKINPSVSSIIFSMAVGLSIFLYSWAGDIAEKKGNRKILLLGISLRAISVLGLTILGYLAVTAKTVFVILFFTLMIFSWPIISVTGTALASQSNLPKGAAMGLFSANNALALSVGSLIGGIIAHMTSYNFLLASSAILMFIGLILGALLIKEE
ncbi:Major Facilitator Superfamily [Thermoanaerobacter sp. YS13]|uniref:MFS transporter n=1 Tax=Thermoanaerobacter sp. YS13 TaxID=1511746 RepID=UPI0005746886|nr:MFS transporter [Thermoanaerobacter sp. YS13]KHO60934.1 Major Facilitator Superfamily [Thermoanaerobacter sp. YS13]